MIQALIIIATISIMAPLILWFIRNWLRIVHKKNYPWLNRILLPSVLIGTILFIVLLCIALFAFR